MNPTNADTEAGRGEGLAWMPLPDAVDLKACPKCGETALEGQEECFGCGGGPYNDRAWREFPRLRQSDPGGDKRIGPPIILDKRDLERIKEAVEEKHGNGLGELYASVIRRMVRDFDSPPVEEGERGASDTYAEIGAALVLAYEDGRRLQDVVVREDVLRKIKALADLAAPTDEAPEERDRGHRMSVFRKLETMAQIAEPQGGTDAD